MTTNEMNQRTSPAENGARDNAELIGVEAFRYLSLDLDRLRKFLNASGIKLDTLKAASEQPGFLTGILEYICSNESELLACAKMIGVPPQKIADARQRLC